MPHVLMHTRNKHVKFFKHKENFHLLIEVRRGGTRLLAQSTLTRLLPKSMLHKTLSQIIGIEAAFEERLSSVASPESRCP